MGKMLGSDGGISVNPVTDGRKISQTMGKIREGTNECARDFASFTGITGFH
jgi:hypothetical protein